MKLAILNGSPRKLKSNSKLLMDKFIEGFTKTGANSYCLGYLSTVTKNHEHLKMITESEYIIIIFPLYADSMPGRVKLFIESLENTEGFGKKKIGFIVQSGFPEAHHSIFVERYLHRLTDRLGAEYLGTVIKGGVEGIQVMPGWMTKKLFIQFYKLGEIFGIEGQFDAHICEELAKPYKMSKTNLNIYKLLMKTGLNDFYWNSQLKKNNAYALRFERPHLHTKQ